MSYSYGMVNFLLFSFLSHLFDCSILGGDILCMYLCFLIEIINSLYKAIDFLLVLVWFFISVSNVNTANLVLSRVRFWGTEAFSPNRT